MYLPVIYGIAALLAVLLFSLYLFFDKRKNRLFLALFGCIAIANIGYFLLSVSHTLPLARIANAVSYFGGAFSILVMLLIIYDVCQMKKRRWLFWLLTGISIGFFALAASGDFAGLYYRSVELVTTDGVTQFRKDYGPLHSLYALYLAGYVLLMLLIIGYATWKKRLVSPKYTAFILVAVLLNVGVWLAEQFTDAPFEFLSISYIATGILLLLLYGTLCDYGIISPERGLVSVQMLTKLNTQQATDQLPPEMESLFSAFAERSNTLSSAERRVLGYYIEGYEIADVPQLAFISINTVKKHNRSIYQKLGVASRDELMLYIELFRCCGRLEELTGIPLDQK